MDKKYWNKTTLLEYLIPRWPRESHQTNCLGTWWRGEAWPTDELWNSLNDEVDLGFSFCLLCKIRRRTRRYQTVLNICFTRSHTHTHIILSSHTFLGDSSNLRCLVWSRFSGGKTKKRGLFKLAPTFWHRKHVYLYPRVQEGLLSHAAGRIEAITVAIFEEQERLRGVSQSKTSLSCEHHHGNLELQLNPQISWLVPFSDICGVYQTPDWHLFQSKC